MSLDQPSSTNVPTVIELLAAQYERQRGFMDSMEQMRWRLTSSLGIGAFATFLISTMAKVSENAVNLPGQGNPVVVADSGADLLVATTAVVCMIYFAGILTQIRILHLFGSSWVSMYNVQLAQRQVIYDCHPDLPRSVFNDMVIPIPLQNSKSLTRFVTVHTANCLVFAAFIGASIGLCAHRLTHSMLLSLTLAILPTIALLVWALRSFPKGMVRATGESR